MNPNRDLAAPYIFVTQIDQHPDHPFGYTLLQNYPNPFNPVTTIEYDLPGPSSVRLSIYNIAGQRIETLVNSKQGTGRHCITWDASTMPSGIYLYSLQTVDFKQTKKMILIR